LSGKFCYGQRFVWSQGLCGLHACSVPFTVIISNEFILHSCSSWR
jgi:hypothetical protein